MAEFDSRRDGADAGREGNDAYQFPKIDLSAGRDIGREYVTAVKITAASPELVVDLFHSITPEIVPIMEDLLLALVREGRLFDPSVLALRYTDEGTFWLRQERKLALGGGGFRELGHSVSVLKLDGLEARPLWEISRCRRRLHSFDVSLTMPNTSSGSRWQLAERIGEALGLGSLRELVAQAPGESLSLEPDHICTRVSPQVTVLSRPPATPEERLRLDRERRSQWRAGGLWAPSSIELSEPLYGEMRGVISALDTDVAETLIGSGLLRYADRIAREGDDIDEERLGTIAKRITTPMLVVFGRSMALGHDPLSRGEVEMESQIQVGDDDGAAESKAQGVDSLTSVDIEGIRSPIGACIVSFSSASQEMFAAALHDTPSFDDDKPVMQVRYPTIEASTTEAELKGRSALTQEICARIDDRFSLESAIAKLDSMGFNAMPSSETQYSRGKIKLTFEV